MRIFIIVLLFCSNWIHSISQTIQISSKFNGKDFIVKNHSDYDSENKPVVFDLTVKLPIDEVNTCIIDIYRLMEDNKAKTLSRQYFKTIIVTKKDAIKVDDYYKWTNSIKINDLFELDNARFMTTKGILFDFYVSSKFLVSIKEKSDCLINESLQINLNP